MEKLAVACSRFKELFPYEGSIGKEKYAEIPRQIRHLQLARLPDLTDIWNQDSQLDCVLQPLETLELTTMSIKKCDGLKEVVANEGEESKDDITFSKLESLEFDVAKPHQFLLSRSQLQITLFDKSNCEAVP
ncbi:hypothetical protein GH714_024225 [Hevea brasiliensis]|uniref:Disease resistance protein At4g27190-like leucine-rich repeats domain-containing protein n=1 Tax=Hevea brasiliensis TaxID=3981 RepID=A0A6A6LDD2_HEVBR|nr:hypothetical protein GH714_024225 [Hevea brasiliensis]